MRLSRLVACAGAAALATPAATLGASAARVCWPAFTTPAVNLPAVTIPAVTIPAVTIPRTCFAGTCYPAQHYPAQHYPAQHYPAQHYPAQHFQGYCFTGETLSVPASKIPTYKVPALKVPSYKAPNLRLILPPSQTTIRVSGYGAIDPSYSPQLTSDYWSAAGRTVSYPDPTAPGYGELNAAGFPKNQYVRPYVRRDGTMVSGYWRNSPSDGLPTCQIISC